ncbi:MAG TPA: ABC transporter permease [Methylomirabilota bacterium]|nr:ABC transporter permease [Methylomirabilota bacterium]
MAGLTRRAGQALLGLAVVLVLWQLGPRLLGVPAYILPGPGAVAVRLWQTLGVQLQHLGHTAATTVIGLALALVVGVLLALLVVYVRPVKAVLMPALAAFNSIPKIAIAPLFVIWFGLGAEPKVLLAFLLGLFPIFVNSMTGLGEIEPDLLDLARLAGGTEWRIFGKVRLMNALPYLADAVKVAFPLALVGSVVGEFIGGNSGVGYLILSAQFNMDTPLVFASLVSITMLTTLGIGLVSLLEHVLLRWRPSRRTR